MDTRLKKSVFLSLKHFVPVTFITVAAEIACIFLRRTLPFNFDAVLFAAAYLTGRIYYPFHTRLCASASCSAAFQARSFAVTTLFFTYGIAAANALIFAAAKVALKLPIKLLIETGYYQIQPPALPLLNDIQHIVVGNIFGSTYGFRICGKRSIRKNEAHLPRLDNSSCCSHYRRS